MDNTLARLAPGQCATIGALFAQGALRCRLLELGLLEGTKAQCLRAASKRGMLLFRVNGTLLALRRNDAALVSAEAEP